jgi:hypothetical protein
MLEMYLAMNRMKNYPVEVDTIISLLAVRDLIANKNKWSSTERGGISYL